MTDQMSTHRSKPKPEVNLEPLRPFELIHPNLGDRTRMVDETTLERFELVSEVRVISLRKCQIPAVQDNCQGHGCPHCPFKMT